ncbi:hypothetical protein [Paractinoplanes lichenicola]|uniref:Uncharacterized protein n=1 Tax=Paractinoplanes lichenicola TaxID=2802976 RepID=A0ABS1VZC5_9ACTN|nr:hypothetical protein [Actinoplanes lichenicola]MBL7259844.1 hypothetical protein [Actinoplanes lichenicola]
MPIGMSRRSLLAAGALILTGPETTVDGQPVDAEVADDALAADAYASFRIVRAEPGAPETPEITLPAGYTFVPGAQYRTASRAEFLQFVQGSLNNAGVPVAVRWPGREVTTVIAGERRLPLRRDGNRFEFTLPVHRATPAADSPTVQVWSHLSTPATGLYWHVEHNAPDRAAGYWSTAAWPAGEAQAVITYMTACQAVLDDSGLIAEARRRRHFYALMGFETNNPIHQDNPPHWHLSYYPGPTMGAAKATVPHFWVDKQGRTFYNGQDVQGAGRTPYRAGQPAPIRDAEGTTVLTTTIRYDGGLDLAPPTGPLYSIVSTTGDFTGPHLILRNDDPWRVVTTTDDVVAGLLTTEVRALTGKPRTRRALRYDPLTGVLIP